MRASTAFCILAAVGVVGDCGGCTGELDCSMGAGLLEGGLAREGDHKQNLNKTMYQPEIGNMNTCYLVPVRTYHLYVVRQSPNKTISTRNKSNTV